MISMAPTVTRQTGSGEDGQDCQDPTCRLRHLAGAITTALVPNKVVRGRHTGCDGSAVVVQVAIDDATAADDSAVVDNRAATQIETAIYQQCSVAGFCEGVVVQV